jgi:CRISPR system Cascade subunit CasA
MKMDHDLLVAALLSWRDAGRRRSKTSLPGLLALLATGELGDFPRLRTHQFHPWCMFLTQLAAIALHRAGRSDPRLSEDSWRKLLLALTAGKHEPWCLSVEDLSQPAFFQPPVPEGTIDDWKRCESPDDIDILVTSKGHDVKTGLMHGDDAEAWVYALSTLQTMQGYPGRGYNRVARMNGGYGSRPRIGLASDHTLSSRFLRDVDVLLASWPRLVERGYRDNGLALVWTQAWDGAASLAMPELTPHFVEVCWRIRCRQDGASIGCLYATTQARRCLPEVDNGDVGDPWVPIERDKGALSVGAGGFHYQLLTRLVFEGDFEPAPAQTLRDGDGDPVLFIASALARGQGKTEGLHERTLALAGTVRLQLGQADARAKLGKRASERVIRAKMIGSKVLFPALKKLASGGKVVDDSLDARVDEIFFDHLFVTLELSDEPARLAWDERLRDLGWNELQRAIERSCIAEARQFKAISDAESMFNGCLRKNFPDLVATQAKSQGAPA